MLGKTLGEVWVTLQGKVTSDGQQTVSLPLPQSCPSSPPPLVPLPLQSVPCLSPARTDGEPPRAWPPVPTLIVLE